MTEIAKAYVQIVPSMQGFGDTVKNTITGETDSAAEKSGRSFGSNFQKAASVGLKALGTMTAAAVAAGGALVKGASEAAQYGDNIDKMSQKMGLSAEAYQEWDAVLQHSGTSIDAMQTGMKTLATAAETGNKAFEKLGITQQQLETMSQQDIFETTITALQNVEDTTQRTYLAGQLLGRGATELGALLNTSAEDTQAMRDRVHELGGVMSNEAVKAAADYQDSLQDMKTAFSGLTRGLTAEFMPGITKVMNGLTEIFSGNGEAGINMIASGISSLVDKITGEMPKFLEKGQQIINTLVAALVDNLPAIIEMGVQLIITLVSGLVQAIPQLIAAIPQIIMAIVNGIVAGWPQIQQAGRDVVNQFGDAIKGLASSAWSWGSDLMSNFIDGIRAWFGNLSATVSSVASTVRSYLHFSEPDKGPLSDFHTYAPDMIKEFVQGIYKNRKLVEEAMNGIGEIASSALESGYNISGWMNTNAAGISAAAQGESDIRTDVSVSFGGSLSALAMVLQPYFEAETTRIGKIYAPA